MSFTCKQEEWQRLCNLAKAAGVATVAEFTTFLRAHYTMTR